MVIKLALVQPDIVWEDIDANLSNYSVLLSNLEETPDVVFLPELFTTGFSMKTGDLSEPVDGKSMQWMSRMAKQVGCDIAGSLIIEEGGRYYNRLVWMQAGGSSFYYDKRHLFRMGEEEQHYTAGRSLITMEKKSFRFRPLICYDLRFPVWSRNRGDYDVLVYLANWPAARQDVWLSLLKARAIENQCYVIGVNRIGKDGMGIDYAGDSLVIDARGNTMVSLPGSEAGIISIDISLDDLLAFRKKFPAWQDADSFKIGDQQDLL